MEELEYFLEYLKWMLLRYIHSELSSEELRSFRSWMEKTMTDDIQLPKEIPSDLGWSAEAYQLWVKEHNFETDDRQELRRADEDGIDPGMGWQPDDDSGNHEQWDNPDVNDKRWERDPNHINQELNEMAGADASDEDFEHYILHLLQANNQTDIDEFLKSATPWELETFRHLKREHSFGNDLEDFDEWSHD